ncbi:hypothetical protein BUALT_Bualt16G0069800 [Buddleja alternifolia]|uniref:Transposase n=1 Tax=Buddleja alternifolia TaxID=168488 RepID=A0AAV6WKJ0_9LAMI|nr:hypothetical protein BUALT_Bualt16G0069800 [Buddleja alternifolia]
MDVSTEHEEILILLEEIISEIRFFLLAFYWAYRRRYRGRCRFQRVRKFAYSLTSTVPKQIEHMHDLISFTNDACKNNLRLDRNAFGRLCFLLQNVGGLVPTRNVQIPEQVAIFLSILAHHKKNMIVKFDFKRSGYTISKQFNLVLGALLKLYPILISTPEPVQEDSTNERWNWFKGCLCALDGTYIPVRVLQKDKARYRNRKVDISVNVLVVCDQNMKYTYILTGWEGSAADSRVLRDAVTRPNGLKIPNGNYYLCDSGYTNCEGFLAPYRGVRYHLRDWDESQMPLDPLDAEVNEMPNTHDDEPDVEFIEQVETSNAWTSKIGDMDAMSNHMRNGTSKERSTKSRRTWSIAEEHALATAMKDLITGGWKCDNGFRTGYQGFLECAMLQAFPGINIRADPHINSKIHVWKKNHASIATMLSRSGFGWNDASSTLDVESDEFWDNYVKRDNWACTMRHKSWPLYKDWCQIFGKDRVTSENAEAFADVVQDLLHKDNGKEDAGGDYVPIFPPTKNEEGDLPTLICRGASSLGDISRRIGFEHDASNYRKQLFETLEILEDLTVEDKITVSGMLVNNTKNRDFFFSLPDQAKGVMVKMMLDGRYKPTCG